jgi:glycosyltransferase involved in cell wall biosynthesis
MRVALVHELLTVRGGAERVMGVIANMFPDAPIYTLLYDERKLGDWFPRKRVRTSNLQKIGNVPFSMFHPQFLLNHHLYLPWFPAAVEQWDFSGVDLVISSSSSFVHGIITNGAPKHLCYVHSPARYLWDSTHDVLERAGQGLLGPLKRATLRRVFHRLRVWDCEVAPRPDMLLAASKEVQRRIELYWRRESTVLTPPLDDFWCTAQSQGANRPSERLGRAGKAEIRSQMQHPEYFLIVSTLAPYKHIERAIEACNRSHAHLKIIGEGPDRKKLERLAGPTIEFYGYRCGDELADLYTAARATIVPGTEDFNIVALESMACGTPVLAFGAGGPLETILEGKTGEFFDEPTAESLLKTIEKFDQKKYSSEECRARAMHFSRQRFEEGLHAAIERLMAT